MKRVYLVVGTMRILLLTGPLLLTKVRWGMESPIKRRRTADDSYRGEIAVGVCVRPIKMGLCCDSVPPMVASSQN